MDFKHSQTSIKESSLMPNFGAMAIEFASKRRDVAVELLEWLCSDPWMMPAFFAACPEGFDAFPDFDVRLIGHTLSEFIKLNPTRPDEAFIVRRADRERAAAFRLVMRAIKMAGLFDNTELEATRGYRWSTKSLAAMFRSTGAGFSGVVAALGREVKRLHDADREAEVALKYAEAVLLGEVA